MSTEFALEFPGLPPDSWRENVAAVIVDAGGRVLLGLGSGGNAYWHFPQGGVGTKETLEEALRRELSEEVGLLPHSYHIVAQYGGLRYRYRRNNDKSARWRGQEQTYFFVLCHASMPEVDCSRTDEFCTLTWVPWRELSLELFAPFKRKVVEKVLSTFFPPRLAEHELLPYVESTLTTQRYLGGCVSADDIGLFAGGKEEMESQLQRLALRLRAAHKAFSAAGRKLLVLVHGAPGSGRRQCLRRLAASVDPFHLRMAECPIFSPGVAWELLEQLPPPGGVSLVLQAGGADPVQWENMPLESWLEGQGVHVLKLCLNAPPQEDGIAPALPAAQRFPWYVIPSARRWYRDYVVAMLVAEALEKALTTVPER